MDWLKTIKTWTKLIHCSKTLLPMLLSCFFFVFWTKSFESATVCSAFVCVCMRLFLSWRCNGMAIPYKSTKRLWAISVNETVVCQAIKLLTETGKRCFCNWLWNVSSDRKTATQQIFILKMTVQWYPQMYKSPFSMEHLRWMWVRRRDCGHHAKNICVT